MKRITLLLVGLYLSTQLFCQETVYSNLFPGWLIKQYRHNFDGSIRDVQMMNDSIGFMTGYHGGISKTTDGGANWSPLNSGTTLHLYSVFFLNENIGYLGGGEMSCLDEDCNKGDILLKTIDGGDTWTKIFKEDNYLLSLSFMDENTGFAVKETSTRPGNFIMKTLDGGQNWIPLIEIADYYNPPIYFFRNKTVCYTISKTKSLICSKDTCNTWTEVFKPTKDISGMYFYNEQFGIITVDNKDNYVTRDGGNSFIKQDIPFLGGARENIRFLNENEGYILKQIWAYEGGEAPVFKGCKVYSTFDGANTWTESSVFYVPLGTLNFLNENKGYSYNGVYFYIFERNISSSIRKQGILNQEIVFYPNPSIGIIYFNTGKEIKSVNIKNLSGQTVCRTDKIENNKLNVGNLNSGIYLMEVGFADQERIIQKMVISK